VRRRGTGPNQACRQAWFEPGLRFETADLMAHIRVIESSTAVAILPDLVRASRAPSVETVELDRALRRTVFTSARAASASRPAIRAVRRVLSRSVEFAAHNEESARTN